MTKDENSDSKIPNGLGMMIYFDDNEHRGKVYEGMFNEGEIQEPFRFIDGHEGYINFHMMSKSGYKY